MAKVKVKKRSGDARLVHRSKFRFFIKRAELWNTLREGKSVEIDLDEWRSEFVKQFQLLDGDGKLMEKVVLDMGLRSTASSNDSEKHFLELNSGLEIVKQAAESRQQSFNKHAKEGEQR